MRSRALFIVFMSLACTRDSETLDVASSHVDALTQPTPPPEPIGLYGEWLRVAPRALAGDTLRLSPDSTAFGVIP
jgi:hypothetical protein